jgi:DNA-binding GntR family transcriptional regulator
MEAIESSSLVESAARNLRAAILAGDLRPGATIRVRTLQETLGISHIPIREALRRLEAEGLVVTRARRTPVVAEVNMLDLNAVYDTRRLIELPIALRARESATEVDFTRVREAYAAYEKVATDPGSTEYWERHAAFHWALLEGGATSWTKRTLDPLWTASERYVRLFVYTFASAEETLCLHKTLLDAFMSPDVTTVARELEHHFDLTVRGVEIGFSRSEDSDQTH